jgi:unsaturated chondroitin disaccharide hydrolase
MRDEYFQQRLQHVLHRIDQTCLEVEPEFPFAADPATSRWETAPDGRWFGGFWVGMLWLAAYATGEQRYVKLAEQWLDQLQARRGKDSVLNGLVFYYGCLPGWLLLGRRTARDLALSGAATLVSSYNPKARIVRAGTDRGLATGPADGETNTDSLPGMSLLAWAARESGDDRFLEIAIQHVSRHIEWCLRNDGSVYSTAAFSPVTGVFEKASNYWGLSDNSVWSRGQSWAMLGFTLAYIWTGAPAFQEAAFRVCDWWLDHVAAEGVAPWDFGDNGVSKPVLDTSSTAMAASAMLKLSAVTTTPLRRERYDQAARSTLSTLVRGYLTPTHGGDRRQPGMLLEGCHQKKLNRATCHELVWGDYFLLELLLTANGILQPAHF